MIKITISANKDKPIFLVDGSITIAIPAGEEYSFNVLDEVPHKIKFVSMNEERMFNILKIFSK